MKVLFVGDEPSSKNNDPNVPFIGTKSYIRLLKFISTAQNYTFETELVNSHNFYERMKIVSFHFNMQFNPMDKVIALGNNASKRLTRMGIKHLKIPHPSPRNRIWNDPNSEEKYLQILVEYLK